MPELVKIQSECFPKLYDAFLYDDDPLSDKQDWRHVFDYQWEKDEDHTGYMLLENDQVIGMMAMAFSKRWIDGQKQKFCNLHTWWVHPDYRSRSVSMLRPLLNLDDYTVTYFTPCDRVRALTERLGFGELNSQLKVLLPPRIFSRKSTDYENFTYDSDLIAEKISNDERRILRDHQPYRVGNFLLIDGDEYCYVLYTHVVRYGFHYCHIHYVSNKLMFVARDNDIRASLMKQHKVRFVLVDCRLFPGKTFRRSFNFWAPAHAMFKSANGVTADQVDNLYSDVVMLRLTVLPHISHEIKELVGGRWLPSIKGG
jgi:hypothetical protein